MNKLPLNINLTIIVPSFNEELNLELTIKTIITDAQKYLSSFEVIIVDDGSTDNTQKIALHIKNNYANIYLVTHKKNLGLGAAILSGVKVARYNLITYLPADGQAYLRDIINGLQIAQNADLVLTYRLRRSDYTALRKLLSLSLTILMRIFFGLRYKDYNWVHIYKKHIFSKIEISTKSVFFLGEIVIKAHQQRMKIAEVESVYRPRRSGVSKTAKFRIVSIAFLDLLRVWYSLYIGKILHNAKKIFGKWMVQI